MYEFTSGTQIKEMMNLCGLDCVIYTYSELFNKFDISKPNFILYETAPRIGHWVTLFPYNNGENVLEFFDSYGVLIDDQIRYTMYDFNQLEDGYQKPLVRIIYDMMGLETLDKYMIVNHLQYQSKKRYNGRSSATCGKWCLARVITYYLLGWTEDDFARFWRVDTTKRTEKLALTNDRNVAKWYELFLADLYEIHGI